LKWFELVTKLEIYVRIEIIWIGHEIGSLIEFLLFQCSKMCLHQFHYVKANQLHCLLWKNQTVRSIFTKHEFLLCEQIFCVVWSQIFCVVWSKICVLSKQTSTLTKVQFLARVLIWIMLYISFFSLPLAAWCSGIVRYRRSWVQICARA
jgi:hypothetical protein